MTSPSSRAIPGMTVIDPMDATELQRRPARGGRRPAARYTSAACAARCRRSSTPPLEFTIGATRLLRDGGDVAFIGTGLGTGWALEAAELLALAGRGGGGPARADSEALRRRRGRRLRRPLPGGHHGREPLGHRRPRLGGLRGGCRGGLSCRVHRRGVPDRWARSRARSIIIRTGSASTRPPWPAAATDQQEANRCRITTARPAAVRYRGTCPRSRCASAAGSSTCAAVADRATRARAWPSLTCSRTSTSGSCGAAPMAPISTASCSRPGTAPSGCSPSLGELGVYEPDELRTYGQPGSRIEESPLEGTPGLRDHRRLARPGPVPGRRHGAGRAAARQRRPGVLPAIRRRAAGRAGLGGGHVRQPLPAGAT